MTMDFAEKTCREFTEVLGSSAPVPGGGGASALAGAAGTALGIMVGKLTEGKKKYAAVEDDIQRLIKDAEKLRIELLELIDKDAECFEPLSKAYGLPAGTDEEKAEKERILEEASLTACSAPVEIMRKCCEAIDLIGEFAEKGSVLAVSDAGAGAVLCRGALQSASLNVFINTRSMKDREKADRLNEEADRMLMKYTMKADEIYGRVYNNLRYGK